MYDSDTKRISRLTAILTQLQSKRLTTAPYLANKFGVSVRTIYRDIRALEQAGIPIITEEGKGYCLMDGYQLPPVSFTENEANALITAERLVQVNRDASFVQAYSDAIAKVKSVLKSTLKEKTDLLSERVAFGQNYQKERTSNYLSTLQFALTNFLLIDINYTNESKIDSQRQVEPFALLSTQENWLLLAWCRLRKEFRYFRLDRINKLHVQSEKFEPHQITLQDFFDKYHKL